MGWIEANWYRRSAMSYALLPLALVYCALMQLRRGLYHLGVLRMHTVGAPVIVVGNISVGGTGKTPLVIWLVERLADEGYRPGIVMRGYRGRARVWPLRVTRNGDPVETGDEAVVLARNVRCPVVVDPNRVRGARALVHEHGCNVIVSDDGLQHYALARDVEIAVVDGARRHGNGFCLPAGPLREPVSRLNAVDVCVVHGTGMPGEQSMHLRPQFFQSLHDASVRQPADYFSGKPVHALAGVGNPDRFFGALRELGIQVTEHVFPDHHDYCPADLQFGNNRPVLMTEKDAVKCERLPGTRGWWLAVRAEVDAAVASVVLARLSKHENGVEAERG